MPAVTVLMPVYNGAPYVKDALESVLAQTFTDFELLLIDDGSTDNTAEIISAYSDSRIRILANPGNLGLVATLNRGLQVAAGAYVAIMHADDICLPERLELQTAYLDIHPEVAMVAAWADFVSASGMPLEPWSEDRIALTPQQIRETLPHTNCIVHPTAMLRTDIARRYLYNGRQHAAEDYDLWLRLSADKLKIGKIDRVLLKYRVHGNSITARSKETLGEYKEIRAKAIFLADSLQHPFRFGALHIYVLRSMVQDFLRVSTNRVKVRFLALARAIFIALGKPFGMFCQKLGLMHHGLLMFISFPLNKVGGAERVHKEIVSCNLQIGRASCRERV